MNGIRWIVVVGSTPFPVDMLRYDQAWPAREIDSITISERGVLGDRCVRLNTLKVPTLDRWAGFGWKVISSNMTDSLPPAVQAGIEKNVAALYPTDPGGV